MTDEQSRPLTPAEIEEVLERHQREQDEFITGLRDRLNDFDDEVGFRSDRGFTHMRPVPSSYGGNVAVYESSAAEHPHIWLRVQCPTDLNRPDGPITEAVAHLPIEGAELLYKQLGHLIENHHQLQDES